MGWAGDGVCGAGGEDMLPPEFCADPFLTSLYWILSSNGCTWRSGGSVRKCGQRKEEKTHKHR